MGGRALRLLLCSAVLGVVVSTAHATEAGATMLMRAQLSRAGSTVANRLESRVEQVANIVSTLLSQLQSGVDSPTAVMSGAYKVAKVSQAVSGLEAELQRVAMDGSEQPGNVRALRHALESVQGLVDELSELLTSRVELLRASMDVSVTEASAATAAAAAAAATAAAAPVPVIDDDDYGSAEADAAATPPEGAANGADNGAALTVARDAADGTVHVTYTVATPVGEGDASASPAAIQAALQAMMRGSAEHMVPQPPQAQLAPLAAPLEAEQAQAQAQAQAPPAALASAMSFPGPAAYEAAAGVAPPDALRAERVSRLDAVLASAVWAQWAQTRQQERAARLDWQQQALEAEEERLVALQAELAAREGKLRAVRHALQDRERASALGRLHLQLGLPHGAAARAAAAADAAPGWQPGAAPSQAALASMDGAGEFAPPANAPAASAPEAGASGSASAIAAAAEEAVDPDGDGMYAATIRQPPALPQGEPIPEREGFHRPGMVDDVLEERLAAEQLRMVPVPPRFAQVPVEVARVGLPAPVLAALVADANAANAANAADAASAVASAASADADTASAAPAAASADAAEGGEEEPLEVEAEDITPLPDVPAGPVQIGPVRTSLTQPDGPNTHRVETDVMPDTVIPPEPPAPQVQVGPVRTAAQEAAQVEEAEEVAEEVVTDGMRAATLIPRGSTPALLPADSPVTVAGPVTVAEAEAAVKVAEARFLQRFLAREQALLQTNEQARAHTSLRGGAASAAGLAASDPNSAASSAAGQQQAQQQGVQADAAAASPTNAPRLEVPHPADFAADAMSDVQVWQMDGTPPLPDAPALL